MSQLQDQRARLVNLLDQEIETVSAILECLHSEQAALTARDSDAVIRIAGEKAAKLALAEDLGTQRRGFSQEVTSRAIDNKKQELKALTINCRELNDANGLLIRRQQQRVETSLNLITGGRVEPSVYGPDGGKPTQLRSRAPLASV